MAITKDKKQAIVKKLSDVAGSAKSVVFVKFHGLPVGVATTIRKSLRDKGIGYFVAKKTLIKIGFSNSAINGSMPELPGEIAVAYGEDPLEAAKGVYEFQKINPAQISIVGGVFENNYADAVYMTALAKVPTREVLYGQFVNMINWPIQSFVMTLGQIADKKDSN
ncbi:MAG: 50S ribosomal protein L10 [Candidatus Vogelbacteria bacterium]|nr:50S ribosomal protein L10 [Candidatus Vogelbacteria bacterium]